MSIKSVQSNYNLNKWDIFCIQIDAIGLMDTSFTYKILDSYSNTIKQQTLSIYNITNKPTFNHLNRF